MSRNGLFTAALVGLIASAAFAASSGPFVYPQKGQSQAQQDQDRAACDSTIGQSSRYCGECGGTPAGNPDVIYKRRDCAAPATCL